MQRLLALALFLCCLSAGCVAERPPTFPRGEDPKQLAEAIQRRSRGEADYEPEYPSNSFTLGDGMTVGTKVVAGMAVGMAELAVRMLPALGEALSNIH